MPEAVKQRTLRIAWLLMRPIMGSGGYHNIFRIANLLSAFGHESVFYIDPQGLPAEYASRPERFIRKLFGPVFAPVHTWPDVIDHVDIALATQWDTVSLLDRCAPGIARAYFVQDFEPFFHPVGYPYLQAEATYRAGLPCITLGHWLATFLHDTYAATTYPFDFAVDHTLYYPRPELRPKRQRVVFYARRSTPRRCFELGVEALSTVHRSHPDTEFVFYGDDGLSERDVPFPFVNRGILDHTCLAELFASATAGLVLSTTNPSLTPPELMASRCAVVDLDLPPNHFLLKQNETALMAAPEPTALSDVICRLLDDEALRRRLVDNAEQHIRPFTWKRSARQIEGSLLAIAQPVAETGRRLPQIDVEHRTGEGLTPALGPGLIAGQRFIPRHDGLTRIQVASGRPGRELPLLRLYDGTAPGSPLVEASPAPGAESWLTYDFGPIGGTRHRPVYFTLSAQDGPQLRFDYAPTGAGSLAYNHVPQPGQLLFRAFFVPILGGSSGATDRVMDEVEYLSAGQALAAEEQQLLNAYATKLQEHAHPTPTASWRDRAGRVLRLLRRGKTRRLVDEARSYIRWVRLR